MAEKTTMDLKRAKRAAVQKLECLERAGISHLPKGRAPSLAGSSGQTTAAVQESPRRAADVAAASMPAAAVRPHADSREAALAVLQAKVAVCTRCAELARTRTQTVFGTGSAHPRLVFLGEAPGADEDKQGKPFVGRAGQLLTDMITKGMQLRREDVYILNVLKCRPPGNRTPLPTEAANCREYLDGQLEILRPEFICCLGAVAAQNLLGLDVPIGRLRGTVHEFHGFKVVCTYHPAYLLRNPPAKKYTWDDLKLLMTEMGLPMPAKNG